MTDADVRQLEKEGRTVRVSKSFLGPMMLFVAGRKLYPIDIEWIIQGWNYLWNGLGSMPDVPSDVSPFPTLDAYQRVQGRWERIS